MGLGSLKSSVGLRRAPQGVRRAATALRLPRGGPGRRRINGMGMGNVVERRTIGMGREYGACWTRGEADLGMRRVGVRVWGMYGEADHR